MKKWKNRRKHGIQILCKERSQSEGNKVINEVKNNPKAFCKYVNKYTHSYNQR